MPNFSDYVVYADESGDHGLSSIDQNYPVFVLVFCIFEKRKYVAEVVPALQRLKFDIVGHDCLVLHEREIRKDIRDFAFLKDPNMKAGFIEKLTDLVAGCPVTLIAAVIDKRKLRDGYGEQHNPYELSMRFCLERLWYYLRGKNQIRDSRGNDLVTHVVFEARGKREDNDLELAFRRVCDGDNYMGHALPFEFVLADKRINSAGLQLADLIARPVGLSVFRAGQPNRAFEAVEPKLYRSRNGRVDGYGLKCFP